jgi:hypothetical protein
LYTLACERRGEDAGATLPGPSDALTGAGACDHGDSAATTIAATATTDPMSNRRNGTAPNLRRRCHEAVNAW